MTSQRLAAPVVAVLLLLLPACGSANPGGVGDRGEAARPPASAPVAPASPAAPSAPSSSLRQPVPAVPQYRATVPPPAREQPEPARFVATSIGVDLRVVRTGVADDGLMQLPLTNTEVAWYAFGSRPGDGSGTTVMAAHVDTRAEGLGPFARLRDLHSGAKIAVADAGGRTHRYTITTVDDVEKSKIALDQLFRRDGPPELKVLTCGGPYSSRTGYRDNIVVTARPI